MEIGSGRQFLQLRSARGTRSICDRLPNRHFFFAQDKKTLRGCDKVFEQRQLHHSFNQSHSRSISSKLKSMNRLRFSKKNSLQTRPILRTMHQFLAHSQDPRTTLLGSHKENRFRLQRRKVRAARYLGLVWGLFTS